MIPKSTLPLLLRAAACAAGLAVASTLNAQTPPSTPGTPANADTEPAAPATPPAPPVVGTKVLPSPDRSTPVGRTITGLLDSSQAVNAIQRQELDGRAPLLDDLQQRMETADKEVTQEHQNANAGSLEGNEKQDFEQSWKDYQKAKSKLAQSIEAARNAGSEHWERVRSTLATDYAFFAAAVAGVEVATPSS